MKSTNPSIKEQPALQVEQKLQQCQLDRSSEVMKQIQVQPKPFYLIGLFNIIDICAFLFVLNKYFLMQHSSSEINIDDLTPLNDRFYICQAEFLGGGSYANVYKGYDKKFKRQIAVKHVKRSDYYSYKFLFQREISVMKKLNHQNIIEFYDSLADVDGLFLFLELCQKQNMKKKILSQLTEEETHQLFRQLVQGMAYMNSLKIFHRDLKPENLLVTNEGKLKIADFGIARQFLENQVLYTQLRCTYYYSAPQILLHYVDYNQKCDVYSAGYILYEMLTCEKIFQKYLTSEKTLKAVLEQVKEKGGWVIEHPSLVNKPHWSKLLKRMLQFDPSQRISFAELRSELDSLKPTDKLPIFRTISQQQQYLSSKAVAEIKSYVQFKLKKQNYLINILKICEHIQNSQSEFLPRVYKLLLLYLTLARYCLMGSVLIEQLSKRDKMLGIDGRTYERVFVSLVVQDKSAVTKYLDEVAIKLNRGKQEIKSVIGRQILPELKTIVESKQKGKELGAIAAIPHLETNIKSCENNYEEEKDMNYDNFLNKTIEICFLTDAQVNNLGIMDLRVYLLLLIVKNYKRMLTFEDYRNNNMPPTFQMTLTLGRQKLIDFITALNREETPIWSKQTNVSKLG